MLSILKLKPILPFFLPIPLTLVISLLLPSEAQEVRLIPSPVAQGMNTQLPQLSLHEGVGLNISFHQLGETIEHAWLDDPSRITLDFDQSLPGAQYLHLRRINTIDFSSLPRTNKTLLTVITNGELGKKRYQFVLSYGTGTPQYVGVTLTPPVTTSVAPPPILALTWELQIRRGLNVALDRGLIAEDQGNQEVRDRVQDFLANRKAGLSPAQSARNAGVSLALIERLAQMGETSDSDSHN